jgi:(1->4)-alpha-D-glucan 1-alpha-D-glucosylmutase
MASQVRIPTGTYRLQFSSKFTFKHALEIIPYLDELGISDVYSSPFFRSRPGSSHGYDVTNHNELNPEIGPREDFDAMVAAIRERNMGQIVDFVPNHMGITDPTNNWWMDVLENGPSSTFASFFDIDWDPVKEQLQNKVLLPILGDQFGKVLERGEFHIKFEEGAFFVTYYDWVLPLNPRTYHFILRVALQKLAGYSDEDMYLDLESILTALEYLPQRTDTDEEKVRERAREKEVVKRRISRLCVEYPQVRDAIEAAMNQVEGRAGSPHSFDRLDQLLGAQAYRLSYWRVAAEEINYRRFFDVNELACIRAENPTVFETIHRLLLELLRSASTTGVRIDHVDGLRNPKQYLQALQEAYLGSAGTGGRPDALDKTEGFYLIVEKILAEDEQFRTDWPAHGTTGYDFASDVTQLLVDTANGDAFSRIYRDFIDRYVHFDSLVYEKKKLVMDVALASDIETLGHMLSELAEHDRLHRDFTLDSLSTVVRELIACFPVYRTYITEETGLSESDRQVILRAVRAAKRRNAATDISIFDFLRDILLLEKFENFDEATCQKQIEFVLKFQQCTGPIMAKGLEDTAFYIFNRLAGLNEVGGNPKQFGITIQRFHERNRARLASTPFTMLTTTTHDTKRSEDVRARIAVLSEIPDEWETSLFTWRKVNAKLKTEIDGESAPSANEEYLLYQTLLGTWPLSEEEVNDDYILRMQQYLLKAIKEAKVNSSWIQPNEDWENAVNRFVSKVLAPEHGFQAAFAEAARKVAWHGMLNSLSQTILKLTCPGIPDLYQGTELWDFSLVDPDNRRPVDFQSREQALQQVQNATADELVQHWPDGLVKLFVTTRLLRLRRREPELFQKGSYASVYANGPASNSCVSFLRRREEKRVLIVVPRLTTRLGQPGAPLDWKDSQLSIEESIPDMEDLFVPRKLEAGSETIPLKSLVIFPFAVFHNLG